MGMFDYVRYSAPCTKCGATLTEWQTKDFDCLLNTLEPDSKLISRWYTTCNGCDTWNEKRFKHTTEIEDVPQPPTKESAG